MERGSGYFFSLVSPYNDNKMKEEGKKKKRELDHRRNIKKMYGTNSKL
jgi:hypothetical protein